MSDHLSNIILSSYGSFLLPWPEDICANYVLNDIDKFKLNQLISLFNEALDTESQEQSATKLSQAFSMLGHLETFSEQKYLTVTGSLKKWEVEDYDNYFNVQREQTNDSPTFLIIRSMIIAYKTFLNLKYFSQNNAYEYIHDPLFLWKRYHWLFFIFIQGNILCMLHLKKEMRKENMVQVGTILKSMSKLMLASGASMLFAGQSRPQEYENTIRPSMMPPHVNAPDFSGLMSYDHAFLMNLWNKEKAIFQLIPSFLKPVYEEFLESHKFLALAHKFVCSKYGGDNAGSLRENQITALENLDKFNQSRRKLIIKNDEQLLNSNEQLRLTDEFQYEEYLKVGFKCYGQLLIKSFH